MGEYAQRIETAGIRHITVKLTRGDVAIERVEGDAIVIESDDPIAVERYDDILQIGPRLAGRAGQRKPRERGRMELRLGEDLSMEMGLGARGLADLSAHLSGLGAQISEAVSMAMESLSGVAGADVRIGVPAILERPTIEVVTASGDLRAADTTAEWALKTGFGDIEVRRCGGALSTRSGKGDIDIVNFTGIVTAVTGSGDVEARTVADRVELRTGSGDITVGACRAGGTLHSGAGDVDGESVGGAWQIRTGSGDVTMRVDSAASLEITTGSGDVDVRGGALHRLRVQTSSGNVDCASLLIGSRHEIISGHGDIELALADPPGARLEVITGHGDVSSVFPLVRVGRQGPPSRGSARYVGNVGDSTIAVELRTSSGDIAIARLELDDALRGMAREARTAEPPEQPIPDAGATTGWTPERLEEPIPPMEPISPVPPVAPVPPIPPMPPFAASEPAAEEPAPPASPAGPSEPAPGETDPEASDADSRLRVLQSLQRGDISVEEAAALLAALG